MSFNFMNGGRSQERLETAYASITKNQLWDWLRQYNSRDRVGCIFNDHPNFKIIEKDIYAIALEKQLDSNIVHDGYSWNWTMNIMEYIANNSIETFRTTFIDVSIDVSI
jgi:hypothetical protein